MNFGMTKLKVIISVMLILILTSSSFGQWGWNWYNPLPQGNNLRKVEFIDNNTGFCYGDHGTFLRTTNAGINWSVSQVTRLKISAMDFINDQTGYINASGWMLKTTNSGLNWFTETQNQSAVFYCMKFLNEMTGFATGAYIYKTTNGGKNWEATTLNVGTLYSVTFLNQSTGFAVGDYSTIIKTTNTGVNWSIVKYSSSNVEWYFGIAFADSLNGHVISGQGNIISTRDAGYSWNYVVPFTGEFKGIRFFDQNTGLAFGTISQGGFVKTTNKGLNWTASNTGGYKINGLDFLNVNSLLAVYDGGKIFRSTNFGQSWDTISKSITGFINRVYFTDSLTGWTGGDRIMKTTNGGINWTKQVQASPYGINDMFFLDRNTGFGIGYSNSSMEMNYFRTTNGGDNWSSQTSNVTYGKFDGISATSKDTVFFVCRNMAGLLGYVYRSINGGSNWTLIQEFSEQIYGIRFVDNTTGFICGRGGLLYKSTNKGLGWNQIQSNTVSSLFRMQFLNPNTGWAYGSSGTIIKTTNGGINWFTQLYINADVYIKGVHFLNQNTGIAVGIYSNIDSVPTFLTVNGGNNWNILNNITNNIADISFISSNRVCEVGNGGIMLFSNSMGYSVPDAPILHYPYNNNTINTLYPSMDWYAAQYADSNNIQISQNTGFDTLLVNSVTTSLHYIPGICILNRNNTYYWRVRSKNFVGYGPWSQVYSFSTFANSWSWYRQMTPDSLNNNSIFMADSIHGLIAGNNGRLLRTITGGDCWEIGYLPETKNLRSVFSTSVVKSWIAGDNGLIYKTSNGGQNWINQTVPYQIDLNSIYFLNQDSGWTVGKQGLALRTINSGINWNSVQTGTTKNINSIRFSDQQTGIAVCDSGLILRTTNRGDNWIAVNSGTSINLISIWFVNSNICWIAGDSGKILKTSDGGNNWITQNTTIHTNLKSIQFTSESRGWIAGDSGYVFATTNSGTTWLRQLRLTEFSFSSIFFSNIINGWVCGKNGVVYATQSGNYVTPVINNNQIVPSDFSLSQNYPNPFNSETRIEYSIPHTSFVNLTIYDVIGRVVDNPVNQKQPAGTYEQIFNVTDYPSGVYFYRLTAEGYSETRKMVVIK